MKPRQQEYLAMIEKALKGYLPESGGLDGKVSEAMAYSLLGGGKRIRPILLLEFCRISGGAPEEALPFACGVEMIHTYSLIHDDLPCMDNDDTRRGKPSNHIAFGEDIALLAGDALLTLAFDVMLREENTASVGAVRALKAASILAKAAGASGMVGGQVIDLQNEGRQVSMEVLKEMDDKKTGALIRAACLMGCVLAGAQESQMRAAYVYAECVGLAFQIVDDILDVTADSAELGKPTGSDLENHKSTYVSLLGLEHSRELVQELTNKALGALNAFQTDTAFLKELAQTLAVRKK